jgi:subtilisin family serine protease
MTSSERPGPTRRSAKPPLEDDQLRERTASQIEIVRQGLGPDNVRWDSGDSEDPSDFDYLYRSDALLVRDEDLDRVAAVVPGEVRDSLVGGVTLFAPTEDEPLGALNRIDDDLGRGVATPDHVVYVAPRGTLCPATEPEEPDGDLVFPKPAAADSSDGRDVLVAVVDTGWLPEAAENPATPWLKGVTGDEETYDEASIREYTGHGTFVAGIVKCLAPAASVRVEGFLPHGGAVFESELIKQMTEALRDAPDIISVSAGTTTRNNQELLAFQVFYEQRLSRLKGTVLLAAAGNDGGRGPFWPAAFPWAVSVGALDADGERAAWSNFGSWVDVYAPGVDLVNAYATGTYIATEPPDVGDERHFQGLARWSGTSFSTPVVAGLVAARMSNTGENARQAADALMTLARQHNKPGVGARLTPGMMML